MRCALETLFRGRIHLEVVDVDSGPAHRESYGERVPVLTADGRELCHFRLDPAAVDAYLAHFR